MVILSDKLADNIDLDLFTDFTVSYVSVLWVDFDLSNDLPLSDLFIMDLSFLILDACGFSVLLTVLILFFSMGVVMASFVTLGFVPISLIPSWEILSVVVTNDFLEDMILVLGLLYPVYYKNKVILPAI